MPRLVIPTVTLLVFAAGAASSATMSETILQPGDPGASAFFGYAVSASGANVLVGAYGRDDNGTDSGAAYLFDTVTDTQLHKLTASDAAAGDKFGYSTGFSGNTAIVGAHMADHSGATENGAAYIFDATTGAEMHRLTASDTATSDFFGVSVDVSGTTAIVGARGDDDAGNNSGAAYVYDTVTGSQTHKLIAGDASAEDFFGRAVAVDGDMAIVGAYGGSQSGTDSGSAYLFDTTTGTQLHKLTALDGTAQDRFGSAVAVSGNVALVGSYLDDDNGTSSGSVYVFDTVTGAQINKLTALDGEAFDYFGRSIAIWGDLAIIGADGDDDNGADSGAAYVFQISTGQQLSKILASDGASGDAYGASVALSSQLSLVGAGFADSDGPDSGSAYLYAYQTGSLLTFATAEVPLPAAFWLLGSALGLLAMRRRRVA